MNYLPRITDFLLSLGLRIDFAPLEAPTFLPGVRITQGGLTIDEAQLLYPGDVLHEAGHLLTLPADIRQDMDGDLPDTDLHRGGELMALAWSYAVCLHLDMPPQVVFHEHGYKSGGAHLVAEFAAGRAIGLPMLQYYGMSFDERQAALRGVPPFPHMVHWVCQA